MGMGCVQAVMLNVPMFTVASKRGISVALVVSGDTIIHTTAEVEKFGVVANLEVLYGICSDISKHCRHHHHQYHHHHRDYPHPITITITITPPFTITIVAVTVPISPYPSQCPITIAITTIPYGLLLPSPSPPSPSPSPPSSPSPSPSPSFVICISVISIGQCCSNESGKLECSYHCPTNRTLYACRVLFIIG